MRVFKYSIIIIIACLLLILPTSCSQDTSPSDIPAEEEQAALPKYPGDIEQEETGQPEEPVQIEDPDNPQEGADPSEAEPHDLPDTEEPAGPELPAELESGCYEALNIDFESAGLSEGDTAIDFTLKDIHGKEYSLSRLLAEKPVLFTFGSFT